MRARTALSLVASALVALAASPTAFGAFPGRNGAIAFSDSPRAGLLDIWSVQANGRGLRQVTHTPAFRESNPSYSPNGRKLAFLWEPNDGRTRGLGVMNADGTGIKHLTSGPAATFSDRPAWSADGRTIYYTHSRTATSAPQIFRISATGGTPAQVSHGESGDLPLTCGDRTHFLFATVAADEMSGGLAMSDLDGSNTVLTGFPHAADDWSPDGKRVLVESEHDIFSAALDGSNQRRLESAPNPDVAAVWSPDGKKFVFYNMGTHNFMIGNSDGSGVRKLLHLHGLDADPTWQPR